MEKLNPEQIKELNEISRLPADQQPARLQEFLSTLSEEQIEFLKSQQQKSCPFCSIIYGETDSKKIYEDDRIIAVLDINPANVGHFISFPKDHVKSSAEMKPEDLMYLISVTNLLAKKMQSVVNAEGFNIIMSNGLIAGQRTEHFIVHCIPRFKNDGVDFSWKSKKIDESINSAILNEFSDYKPMAQEKPRKKEPERYEAYYEEERIP
ncbi:MAG: HIT family protein [Nanoarchaeota archaeon]